MYLWFEVLLCSKGSWSSHSAQGSPAHSSHVDGDKKGAWFLVRKPRSENQLLHSGIANEAIRVFQGCSCSVLRLLSAKSGHGEN